MGATADGERPTTLWDLVDTAAAVHPARVMFADNHGRALTAADVRDAAERVAAGLSLRAGQVVSWQLPTVLESVVLLVALARAGAVQNPIIPILREREVGAITEQIATSLLVVPETWRGFDAAAMARTLARDRHFDVVAIDLEGETGATLRLPEADPRGLPAPPADAHAYRWAYFTSGTTAAPKGVRHTDASVIASSYGMTDLVGLGDGDVYPIAWPITHIGGVSMIAAVLRAGGKLVLFDEFDPATIGEQMATVQPTLLGTGVPFFRAYLDAQRRHGDEPLFPHLRVFVAGGAPTPPEMINELRRVFHIDAVVNAWGLTEFPVATSGSPTDAPQKLATTIGRPCPGVRVRVVDGELRVKGHQCFAGYVDASLDGSAFDDEGWFRTGDLGAIDDDGYVTLTGRLKDVIIRNGENISALEIEDVLLRHPDIADVSVIGVPDARTGERVCAVVVARAGSRVTLETIAAHCAAQGIAKQKTPEQVEVVDAISRNAMGKVVKADLRARVLGG